VRFLSTRGGAAPVVLSEALARGLAPDGGLYVPEVLPAIDWSHLKRGATLQEVALHLLSPLFAGDALAPALSEIVHAAFDFSCPLVQIGSREPASGVLELFHGPTAAFKDFGARFLAECLSRQPGPALRTVLVATSGDTGGAVAAAFWRRAGFRVVILYPQGMVSARQEHQLTAFGGNVQAYAVAGSFDDCQALVKRALNDATLVARHGLTSANSISLGRLFPQMAYHAYGARAFLERHGEAPGLLVPTGNLGNALSAVLARALGAPIGRIVLCVNANRTLARFLRDGVVLPRPTIATIANAMDVSAPSNLERLRWLFPDHARLVSEVSVESCDDDTIRAAIVQAVDRHTYVACPHTATALAGLMARRDAGDLSPWLVVATAHPAKFETVVEPLLGHALAMPPALSEILERPRTHLAIPADFAALVATLAS